jgi:hypothetical protein
MSSVSELTKKKKDELVAMCKERGLPFSGSKPDLAARLLGQNPPPSAAKKKRQKKNTEERNFDCFEVVSKNYIHAQKNAFGNYEHLPTGLCFDPETNYVIGKQDGEKLVKLTIEDAEFCEERRLLFNKDIVDRTFLKKEEDIETVIETLIKQQDASDYYEEEEEEEQD